MPVPERPIESLLNSRLRKQNTVSLALERLTAAGKIRVSEIQRIACDPAATLSMRIDAITIFLALRKGSRRSLRQLLNSENRTIVIETLKGVKLLSPDWALTELVSGVQLSEDPTKRAVFVWAVSGYHHRIDVETLLLNLLASETVPTVRDHTIEALGEFHSERVLQALLQVLAIGSDSERFWALYSLGNVANAGVNEAIRPHLNDQTVIPGFGSIKDEAQRTLTKILDRSKGNA